MKNTDARNDKTQQNEPHKPNEIECPLDCDQTVKREELREHYLESHPQYSGMTTQPARKTINGP